MIEIHRAVYQFHVLFFRLITKSSGRITEKKEIGERLCEMCEVGKDAAAAAAGPRRHISTY